MDRLFRKRIDVPGRDRIIWVDLEMTGLDVEKCHILEIACIITDGNLNIIAQGPQIVIHQSEEILESMNDWCKRHHGPSGLTQSSRDSGISLMTAEMTVLSFVRKYTPRNLCPLAGNSIGEDKKFLEKYMPQFMNHVSYRIIDVNSLNELCRRWYPSKYMSRPKKIANHRALDDIKESIKELEYYRLNIFG